MMLSNLPIRPEIQDRFENFWETLAKDDKIKTVLKKDESR